ncbi:hypothetical protein NX059_005125 [Plenodomus lindquistii]|nr:hypothetical protein NX059_005125 [Plenodomus lindquistii]
MSSMDADGDSATSCAQTTKRPDEWHHIADSTQRKKVQNRNAQRIYRHKLKRRIAELEKINSKLVAHQNTCTPQPEDSRPANFPTSVRPEPVPALVRSSSTSSPCAELPHTSDSDNNDNNDNNNNNNNNDNNHGYPFSLCSDDMTYSPQALWPHPNDSPLPPALDPLLQIPSFSLDFPVDMGATCSYEPFSTLAATTSSPSYAPITMEDVFAHDVSRDKMNAQPSGATPLHLAAAGGHQRAVAVLLGFPALSDPNALDASLQTPLHLAAAAGCEPVVQMLLDAGAHVQSKAANGWTPLHAAGCAGHDGVVKLLLQRGAEIDCRVTPS